MSAGQQTALPWSGEAQAALKSHHRSYGKSIQELAHGLAIGDRSERVLVRHVEDAARIAAKRAHDHKPWYKRHEMEAAVGGWLCGAATALPDVMTGLFGQQSTLIIAMPFIMLAVAGFGIAMACHGVLCGRGWFV